MVGVWLKCHKWIKLGMKRCRGERAGIERESVSRADQRVLRWWGHVEIMVEYHIARRVFIVDGLLTDLSYYVH